MKKMFFGRIMIFMLILSVFLGACSSNDKKEDNDDKSVSSEQSEKKTEEDESEEDEEKDNKKSDSGKSLKDAMSKKQSGKKAEGEEAMQGSDELPELEYTYEAIVNAKGGIVRSPHLTFVTNRIPKDTSDYYKGVAEELEKLDPIDEDASDEDIEVLFREMLRIGGMDYTPLDTVDRMPYVIFQSDGVDPWTNRKVVEGVKVNVEIVLDASGSMAKQIDGVEMMDIAKNSIKEVLEKMPADANVGLRVFGHLGDNSQSGKEVSCGANELIHPITPLDINAIESALGPIEPTGWTSIALSIENGINDFKEFNGEDTLNILYIITDGIETCGGDPVEVASQLSDGNTNVLLGIIGFNVDANQNSVLKSIADAANGYYTTASDAQNLTSEFEQMYIRSVFNYEWQPLTDGVISQIENEHQNILSSNKNFAEYIADNEQTDLNDVISCGSDFVNPIYGVEAVGLYKDYDGKVMPKLEKMAEDRAAKIKPLYMDKYAELEKQSQDYIAGLQARKGEMVAMVPSLSRLNVYDIENGPWKKGYSGGTEDDAKADTDRRKKEQEEKIEEIQDTSESSNE